MNKRNRKKLILAGIVFGFSLLSALLLPPPAASSAVFGSTLCRDGAYYAESALPCGFTNKNIGDIKLIPGGFPFGVKLYTKGVMVVGLSDIEADNGFASPAADAGFKKGDIITRSGDVEINTIEQISDIIEQSNGATVNFSVMRGGEALELELTPVKAHSDGKYKSGMWIRDSTAGIGTVTFIEPETLAFGGLGHGICDSDTGALMPLSRGTAVNVEINNIIRGIDGRPGELKGDFGFSKIGALLANTSSGVFGVFDALPEKVAHEPLAIASKSEVTTGKAHIYSSIFSGQNNVCEIEITKINADSDGSKSFVLRVTDPSLIEQTGGIIQGMSGSPIIQNGKLVGAVTHVCVNL